MRRLFPIFALIAIMLLTGCGADERKQAYFERGMALLKEGDPVKAKLEFKNALQIDPKDAEAWFQLAEIEANQRNWANAFGAYSKTIELDPEHWSARLKRGQLLVDANQPKDALADAEAILASNPQDPDALALRATAKARQGDTDGAKADAEAALSVDPKHRNALAVLAEVAIRDKHLDEAKAILERAIQGHPTDIQLRTILASVDNEVGDLKGARQQLEELVRLKPEELSHTARLAAFLTKQGQPQAAEKAIRDAISATPDQPQAKLLLVDWTNNQRGADAAVALLKQFIADQPDVYELKFALADFYLRTQRQTDAEDAYRSIIEQDGKGPEGLKARSKLAALRFASKQTEEAEALVSEVLEEAPRDIDALMVRAAVELSRNDANRAVADLRDVLQNAPNSTKALLLLATAHKMRNELPLARDALEKAIAIDPNDSQSYLALAQLSADAGDMQGASGVLERYLERSPDNELVQGALARVQLGQADWAAMEKTADHIIETRPEHPLGYYLKGLAMEHAGNFDDAIKGFETALAKRPDAVEPLLALSRTLVSMGKPEKAEARLKKLLSEQQVNAAAMNLLGQVYVSMRRFDEAKQQYQKIVSLYPHAPTAYGELANLFGRAGETAQAISTLEAGVKATNRNAYLVFRLGVGLQDIGRNKEAIAAYEEVLQTSPEADAVANNLAMLLVNQAAPTAADLERAQELVQRFRDSDQWVFLDTLGWIELRTGDTEKALAALEKAASFAPQPPPGELEYHLGMVYAKLGRTEEAKRHLNQSLKDGAPFPGADEAKKTLESL